MCWPVQEGNKKVTEPPSHVICISSHTIHIVDLQYMSSRSVWNEWALPPPHVDRMYKIL